MYYSDIRENRFLFLAKIDKWGNLKSVRLSKTKKAVCKFPSYFTFKPPCLLDYCSYPSQMYFNSQRTTTPCSSSNLPQNMVYKINTTKKKILNQKPINSGPVFHMRAVYTSTQACCQNTAFENLFVTEIKMKSSGQHSFKSQSRDQSDLQTAKLNRI